MLSGKHEPADLSVSQSLLNRFYSERSCSLSSWEQMTFDSTCLSLLLTCSFVWFSTCLVFLVVFFSCFFSFIPHFTADDSNRVRTMTGHTDDASSDLDDFPPSPPPRKPAKAHKSQKHSAALPLECTHRDTHATSKKAELGTQAS